SRISPFSPSRIYCVVIAESRAETLSHEMSDRVGVVGEEGELLGVGGEEAVGLVDHVTQAQHAQADGERVVEVAARQVAARPLGLQALQDAPDLGLDLELGER